MSYVIQSEPTIRLVLVACRLSRSLRKPKAGRKLPLFDFWRSSLRRALDEDPFWGPAYSKHIEERAAHLEIGIQQLIKQCCELSEAVSADGEPNQRMTPAACFTPYHEHIDTPSMQRRSSLKRQITQPQGEQSWMEKIVIGCWTTLLADAARATRSEPDPKSYPASSRARSLST